MTLSSWFKQLLGWASGKASRKRRCPRLLSYRNRPLLKVEQLEDRLAPAVVLTYNGPGSPLSLIESVSATTNVTISEVSANDLRIDLHGATFDANSSPTTVGLSYQNAGSPSTSTFADLDITTSGAITTLTVDLGVSGDQLNFGTINDSAGGLGNLTATSDTIHFNGVVDLSNSTTGQVVMTAPTALTITGTGGIASASGDVTLSANSLSLGGAIRDIGNVVTLSQADTTTFGIDLGANPSAGNLGLAQGDLNEITAGTLRIGRTDNAGDVTVTAPITLQNVTALDLETGGAVVDNNTSGPDISVANLAVSAVSGIGASANPIETRVSNLAAQTATGGIFVSNSGALALGYTGEPFQGVVVSSGGDIALTASGTISVTNTADIIQNAAGNITLTASGAMSDIVAANNEFNNNNAGAVVTNSGNITLQAGEDVVLGTTASDTAGDLLTFDGGILLTAGRDLIVQGGSFVLPDSADGFVTANAVRNLTIRGTGNFFGTSIITSFGAAPIPISLTASGTFTADVGNSDAIQSGGGNITISAGALDLRSGINAGAGSATLEQASTLAENIDLGGAGGAQSLSLTDAELAQVTAGILRIGRLDNAGDLTVTAPITAHAGFNTLALFSAGAVKQSSGATLAVANLAVTDGGAGGVQLTGLNAVATVAGTTTAAAAAFSFTSNGALTIGAVDGVSGLSTTAGTVSVTAGGAGNRLTVANAIGSGGAPLGLSADQMTLSALVNAGSSTVTLSTVTASQPVTIGTQPGSSLGLLQADLSEVAAGAPVIIQGSNTFTVGDGTNSLSFLTSALSLVGLGSADALTLHDEGNVAGRVYIVTSTEVDPTGTGHIRYAGMKTLNLNGGQGGDQINVFSLGATTAANLNGGGGNDTFNLGASANSLAGIQGPVNIIGGGFSNSPTLTFAISVNGASVSNTLPVGDLVQIIDQNDASGSFTLTGNTVQRAGAGLLTLSNTQSLNVFLSPSSSVSANSTPAGIDQFYGNGTNNDSIQTTAGNSVVRIWASAVGSTTTVTTTGTGSLLFIGGNSGADALTLQTTGANSGVEFDGGVGNDTVAVQGTGAGSLTLTTDSGGTNSYALGNSSNALSGIQGNVSVNETGGTADLILNDQGDTSARTYGVSGTEVDRSGAGHILYAGLTTLTLNGSQGNDVYNITSKSATTLTGIYGGAGNDTFNVSVGIASGYGGFLVGGGGGANTLAVTDSSSGATMRNNAASATSGSVTVDYTTAGALHSQIVYQNFGSVSLVPGTVGAAYVQALFVDILGRAASQQELTSFTNYLNSNGRLALVTLLENTPTAEALMINRYVEDLFQSPATTAEIQIGEQKLQGGATEEALLNALFGSAITLSVHDLRVQEFTADIVRLLGRTPSAAEVNSLVSLDLRTFRELIESGTEFFNHVD